MDALTMISTGASLLLVGFNAAMFIVIKFNDLHHLTQDVKELTKVINNSIEKQEKIAERIATIEGKCSSNHK